MELAVRAAHLHRRVEAAGDVLHQHDRRGERADDVDAELHHLDPHHRFHPAEEGEDDHHHADADDRGGDHRFGRHAGHAAVDRGQDERGEQQPHAVRDRSHADEERRSQRAHFRPEALLQQLVHRDQVAGEVRGDEEDGDHHPPDQVAEHKLQEGEVAPARVGDAGDGDEGDGRCLSGHDRRADGPPRHMLSGQEVLRGRLLLAAEPRARSDDRDEVADDDDQIDGGQGGGL